MVISAGWSQNTGQYYATFTETNCDPDVFEFSRKLPMQIQRGPDFSYKPNQRTRTISGSLWCPWQENLLFSISKNQLHLVDAQR